MLSIVGYCEEASFRNIVLGRFGLSKPNYFFVNDVKVLPITD